MKEIFKKTFRRIRYYFKHDFSTTGSIFFLCSSVILYTCSFLYIQNLAHLNLFFGKLGFEKFSFGPLAIFLFFFHLISITAIQASTISQKTNRIVQFLVTLIMYVILDFLIFNWILQFNEYHIHSVPLLISILVYLFASIIAFDAFNLKFRYKQIARTFFSIFTKKINIKIKHVIKYTTKVKSTAGYTKYSREVDWSLDRKIVNDMYLDRIIDYDSNGDEFVLNLEKYAYDILNNELHLKTKDREEVILNSPEEAELHLKTMNRNGWEIEDIEMKRLLIFGLIQPTYQKTKDLNEFEIWDKTFSDFFQTEKLTEVKKKTIGKMERQSNQSNQSNHLQ